MKSKRSVNRGYRWVQDDSAYGRSLERSAVAGSGTGILWNSMSFLGPKQAKEPQIKQCSLGQQRFLQKRPQSGKESNPDLCKGAALSVIFQEDGFTAFRMKAEIRPGHWHKTGTQKTSVQSTDVFWCGYPFLKQEAHGFQSVYKKTQTVLSDGKNAEKYGTAS